MANDERHSEQAEPLSDSPALQLIYETAPIGLAFLSTDCRYVMINQHLTEICGISIADHIGRSVRETVPQVAEQVEQLVQTILRTGEPITGIEVNGQRPDGSNVDRTWITYWHPLKDRSGNIVGINVAAEEITARKRADADLSATQERLRNLNETLAERVEAQAQERDRIWKLSQDLLIVSELSGKILNVNPAWSVMLGWSPDDLIGNSGEWLVHPDDRERSSVELANLIAGEKTQHLDNRILCKDGSYRWLSWFAVPNRGIIYSVGRDITNLKQTQEQLDTLRRQLAHASRQTTVGAMTASIAHEIKQPLAAIVMNANAGQRWLNKSDPNLAEVQRSLEQIVRDGHRMGEVITSIRAMFGKDVGETSRLDICILVGEVLELTRGELERHQILLSDDMHAGLPAVMAERVQLQQVLLNLIMNAIEAMSSVTGRERHLRIESGLDEQANVRITVEDTGCGIAPALLDRIFDPFFTTKSNGMGLGLSICRSIIEAYGGRLWATPRSPNGAAFHLSLPGVETTASGELNDEESKVAIGRTIGRVSSAMLP
jgi:PAS domain S-box-containing protein